jgi:hypothetical protein
MGLLDRLKNNRPDDDGAGERTPTNFDELQAEGDEGRTVAMGITRAADLDLPTAGANLTSTVGARAADAADRPRREERQCSAGPAEDADPGQQALRTINRAVGDLLESPRRWRR